MEDLTIAMGIEFVRVPIVSTVVASQMEMGSTDYAETGCPVVHLVALKRVGLVGGT